MFREPKVIYTTRKASPKETLDADLKVWLHSLLEKGPSHGHFPEPHKSFLVVSRPYELEAKEAFSAFGVTVVSGHRFLGGFIGDADERRDCIQQKVTTW